MLLKCVFGSDVHGRKTLSQFVKLERLCFKLFKLIQNHHRRCRFLSVKFREIKARFRNYSLVMPSFKRCQVLSCKSQKTESRWSCDCCETAFSAVKAVLSGGVLQLTRHLLIFHRTVPSLNRPAQLPSPVRSASLSHQRQATMRRPPLTIAAAPHQIQGRRK